MPESLTGPFPDLCRHALVEQAPPILDLLRQTVLWKDNLNARACMALQAIYPLSYLHATSFAGNPYRGDPELLRTIEETGDFLAACVRPRRNNRFAATSESLLATLDWAILFWLDGYVLIREDLNTARRRRWEAAITSVLRGYERRLRGFMDQARFNSSSFRTSPNHAISYATDLLVGGIALGSPAWRKLAEDFAQRFVECQRSAGYWAEGGGPVCGYQAVSMAGIARFNALRPKAIYREALARALDYHETISYPDHTFVALVDKRQRYSGSPNIHGLYGFGFLPRGRALAKEAILAAMGQSETAGPSFWARLLENAVYFRPGPIPRYKPWRGQRLLENHSCFVREGSWQYDLSVNPVVVHPKSPFRLDHEVLFSVWHASVGLIVSGSQDKNRPRHNTFHAKGGVGLGILYGGRIGNLCEPRYLEAFYANGVTGRIEVSLRGADTLELAVSLPHSSRREGVFFNLPLRVGLADTVKVARGTHVLTRKTLSLPVAPREEVMLFDGRVGIRSQAGGRLHFPCLPFNPYSKGNRSTLGQAFLRFEIPVSPGAAVTRIRIRARP